jgi:hypothetical protein
MIRGFQRPPRLEAAPDTPFQWNAALLAGLIAGAVLLIVPAGSPWSRISFFSPVVMGRTIPPQAGLPLVSTWLLHLLVSLIYGLIVSLVAMRLRRGLALLAGAITGLVLYAINFGIVSLLWPDARGNEVAIAFAHVVFGLVAAGAYRGLLRRTVQAEVRGQEPGFTSQ